MTKFKEFVDKKERESKHQLEILANVLESKNVKLSRHLDAEDPYLFVESGKDLSFDGVRIYKVGSQMAFRVQKEKDTHPYGSAYPLNAEEWFRDYMNEYRNPDRAGNKTVEALAEAIEGFFMKSAKAEKRLKDKDFRDPLQRIVINPAGTDYSLQIHR